MSDDEKGRCCVCDGELEVNEDLGSAWKCDMCQQAVCDLCVSFCPTCSAALCGNCTCEADRRDRKCYRCR